MEKIMIIVMTLCLANGIFVKGAGGPIELKKKIATTPISDLPFDKGKTVFCPASSWGYTPEQTLHLPMFLYKDLGLTEKFDDPNATCIICHKFQMNDNFDFVALDISVSDWSKQLLATYKNGEFIDCIESEVYCVFWFIKQWRITAEKEIIVTSLNVESSTPISGLSDFEKVNAQRIDTYYKVDDSGKFYETKQVKYKPQVYTKANLEDRNKNIWEGDEVPVNG